MGSASDSNPEGWEFEPPCPHFGYGWFAVWRAGPQRANREEMGDLRHSETFSRLRRCHCRAASFKATRSRTHMAEEARGVAYRLLVATQSV